MYENAYSRGMSEASSVHWIAVSVMSVVRAMKFASGLRDMLPPYGAEFIFTRMLADAERPWKLATSVKVYSAPARSIPGSSARLGRVLLVVLTAVEERSREASSTAHSYVSADAGCPGMAAAEVRRSLSAGGCFAKASSVMSTEGRVPATTVTFTVARTFSESAARAVLLTTSSKLKLPAGIAPAAMDHAHTVSAGGSARQAGLFSTGVHRQAKRSVPHSPAALHCAVGSSGSFEWQPSRKSSLSWPTVRSAPLMPPPRGSSRRNTSVSALPQTAGVTV